MISDDVKHLFEALCGYPILQFECFLKGIESITAQLFRLCFTSHVSWRHQFMLKHEYGGHSSQLESLSSTEPHFEFSQGLGESPFADFPAVQYCTGSDCSALKLFVATMCRQIVEGTWVSNGVKYCWKVFGLFPFDLTEVF